MKINVNRWKSLKIIGLANKNIRKPKENNVFFVKLVILCIQNAYVSLWWVDVSHISWVFHKKHGFVQSAVKSGASFRVMLLTA